MIFLPTEEMNLMFLLHIFHDINFLFQIVRGPVGSVARRKRYFFLRIRMEIFNCFVRLILLFVIVLLLLLKFFRLPSGALVGVDMVFNL